MVQLKLFFSLIVCLCFVAGLGFGQRYPYSVFGIESGLRSLQAVRAIRAAEASTGQHVPIVMLTANAMEGDGERSLAVGANGYLTKPVSDLQLAQAVAQFGVSRV